MNTVSVPAAAAPYEHRFGHVRGDPLAPARAARSRQAAARRRVQAIRAQYDAAWELFFELEEAGAPRAELNAQRRVGWRYGHELAHQRMMADTLAPSQRKGARRRRAAAAA